MPASPAPLQVDFPVEATLGSVLSAHAKSQPNVIATAGDVPLTYAELSRRSAQVAAWLKSIGIARGDHVAWLAQNSCRYLEVVGGCGRIGAVLAPLNWRSSTDELDAVLADLDPSVVFWQQQEIGERIRSTNAFERRGSWINLDRDYERLLGMSGHESDGGDVRGADALLCIYTAAFAGRPRGALLSHRALLTQGLRVATLLQITDDSVFLNAGPLFHIGTLMATFGILVMGGRNVFVRRNVAGEILDVIEAERVTHAFLAKPALDDVVDHFRVRPRDVQTLWESGSPEPFRSSLIAPGSSRWAQRPGGYGQTEVCGLATFDCLGGRPGPLVEVDIIDPGGTPVATGEIGEIVVRGPIVMNGYLTAGAATAERLIRGWHRTNDLGRRDADGSLTFVAPMQRIIKSGGENIYPAEVESCINEHPGVANACVIGRCDDHWGQTVVAIVEAAPGSNLSETDIIDWTRVHIASYKKPNHVVFTDALPRAAGQIDRDAVDAIFGGGCYPGSDSGRSDQINSSRGPSS